MSTHTETRGSWGQRTAIYLLSIVLGLLVYWLIGFFLDDIATIPGPQQDQYMAQVDQSSAKKQADVLDQQINQLHTEISNTQEQQKLLKNALTSTQNSINQILEIQKLQAEKGQAIASNLTNTFQQNTQLFITQQNSLQQLNAALTKLNMQLMPLQNSRDVLGKQIDKLTTKANKEYDTAMDKFQLKLGLLQIGLLVALLAIVVFLLFNRSTSYYRLILTSIGIAVLIKIFFVIHDYFPSEYFKYILTFSLIIFVFLVLKDLLKRRAFPARSYLLKQFRDAYEHFFCPSCEYPIRRGPMRYVFWTRRSLKYLKFAQSPIEDQEPYHCPHCGTSLYQNCQKCQKIQPSLLPFCEHCGAEHSVSNT